MSTHLSLVGPVRRSRLTLPNKCSQLECPRTCVMVVNQHLGDVTLKIDIEGTAKKLYTNDSPNIHFKICNAKQITMKLMVKGASISTLLTI